jgi:hypothetical protein
MPARFEFQSANFGTNKKTLAEGFGFRVSTFRFNSGVAALQVESIRGEIVVLPFLGHQIWSCSFDERNLTMKSMFGQPVPTNNYLETYGAFFLHCGVTAIGAPGPEDRHPIHGELPLAPFRTGYIEFDEVRRTCSVVGIYEHTVAFSDHYMATSTYTMQSDSTLLDVSIKVDNIKNSPMDLMYLGHANFRPVDDGELFYSARLTPETVRVRRSIPPHIKPKSGYREFLDALASNPGIHHKLRPNLAFDPEVAMMIDMISDEDGFAHALLKHPDGAADYVRYRPDQCGQCCRWICRTPDQDAIGIALPCTSEVEGYAAEKKKGLYVTVNGGESWSADIRLGTLSRVETAVMIPKIVSLSA